MAGQHINDLKRSVAGMSLPDVYTSYDAWEKGADALARVAVTLARTAPKIKEGFGEESETGASAEAALLEVHEKVSKRYDDMYAASLALLKVHDEMTSADAVANEMPDSPPGPKPTFKGGPGETVDEITALKIYTRQLQTHNTQVDAYADADERARARVEALNTAYDEASEVLARIHGEPVGPGPGPGPTTGPGPGPNPGPGPGPITGPGPGPITGPGPGPITGPGPGPITGPGPGPGPITGPGPGPVTGPGLGGIDTGTAATIGAGALGGLGLRGLLARSGSVTAPGGTPTRPIGASGRTGAGSVLSRGGVGAPGQAAGARGAAGRGVGAAGQASGRSTGGRGAGGRGAGGRGGLAGAGAGARGARGKNERERTEEEWTDDEGQFPDVIR